MKNKKKSGISRLIELAGEKKTLMIWCGILSTISVFFLLVPYFAVYHVMAELLKNASDIWNVDGSYLIRWALLGVGGMVLGYLFMYVGGMIGHIAAFRILYGLRIKICNHIGKLPLGFFNKNSTGKVKQIIETDVEQIESFIAHQLPDLINTAAMLIVMVTIMLSLNGWLTLACIIPIFIGFSAQFSMMLGKEAQAGLKEYYDALEDMNTSAIQYVRGMASIKIFGQTVHSFRKFYGDMIKYRDFNVKYAKKLQNGYVLFRVIVLSLATFVLPVGLFFFTENPNNTAFVFTFIFFLVLAPGIATPIFKLNNLAMTFNSISEGVKRIDEIMDKKIIEESKDKKQPSSFHIGFNNVSFSYDGHIEILKDISFTAAQGKITALVGPSGSGKSTIAQLIPRFWDISKGNITIGGVDIREMQTNDLMNVMSFVFQDSFMFSDTLYNNILAGRPSAKKEEVYAAAKAAQCHEFIERLPQGYDTPIGEGGVYLSGGEEQRVSVARAILKNAPILVLDEATAYADPENEYQMQLALQELIKNKTVLIIAHRLTTISSANQILVIKDGCIDDRGTHEDLISHNGLYKKMWDAYTHSYDWQIQQLKTEEVTSK